MRLQGVGRLQYTERGEKIQEKHREKKVMVTNTNSQMLYTLDQ